jgi:hypothetical protein
MASNHTGSALLGATPSVPAKWAAATRASTTAAADAARE